MTIPTLMNCSHSPDGWCLTCVSELQSKVLRLQKLITRLILDDEELKETEPLLNQNGSLYNVMAKVKGEAFRCECGCNVFHHPDKDDLSKYECNSCEARYTGLEE